MTGDGLPQTTVVIPAWDDYVAERLEEALASVRSQDVRTRVLVVDNASGMEVPELPGVSVVRARSRQTLGSARNLGLAEVDTRFVLFLDADDLLLPGAISFLESAMVADPDLVAFGMAIVEDPSGDRHRWPRRWISLLIRVPRLFALLDAIWSMYPTTGATIIRTELAAAAGGYADAESGEDWCLGVSLAFRGRIGWSEEPGRLYRLHDRSVWARHMTVGHQIDHARNVRRRIRQDPGIAQWARAALPLLAFGQYLAIGAHAAVAGARRRTRHRSAPGHRVGS